MKGIILAGGSGTRLYPLTTVVSKQILPVYDKPMIYYPLSTLMVAGIRDVLIISTPKDIDDFKNLLGDGSTFGMNLSYAVQPLPQGLAQAFIIGEEFIGGEPCAMILGDNIFYGSDLKEHLQSAIENIKDRKATIFGYHVRDPQRFGIVEVGKDGSILSIEEKPKDPKSNYCVTGLYFYDGRVAELAKTVVPSARGELEITDLNNIYLGLGDLKVEILDSGFAWMDAGTFDSLAEASEYVRNLSQRQNLVICAPEEIAFHNGWISVDQLKEIAEKYKNSPYGQHLMDVVKSHRV